MIQNILSKKNFQNMFVIGDKEKHINHSRKTRMIPFIKANFKKSDVKTNIDKCRVAANITVYHIRANFDLVCHQKV